MFSGPKAYAKALFWNSREGRLRALWRLLVLLLLIVVTSIPLFVVIGWVVGISGSSLGAAATGQVDLALSAVAGPLAVTASMWLAARFLDRRPFVDFGFHFSRGWWLDLAFGLFLGALLMIGIFLAEWVLGWVAVSDTFVSATPEQPFILAILVPLFLFLWVGIYEEMLTRGYFIRNLSEGLNFSALGPGGAIVLAWVASSFLFGLGHAVNPNASVISTANIALAGLFLGLGYVLTGELAVPIGLHITWNFFQGNVFGFPVSGADTGQARFIAITQMGPDLWTGGPFGPEAGLISLAAMVVGSLLIVGWVRYRYGQVGLKGDLARYRRPERGTAGTAAGT